jgi:hypothetical protein
VIRSSASEIDDDEIIDAQKETTVLSHCESERITRYHGRLFGGHQVAANSECISCQSVSQSGRYLFLIRQLFIPHNQ